MYNSYSFWSSKCCLMNACVKIKSGHIKTAQFCTTNPTSFPHWEPLNLVLGVQSAMACLGCTVENTSHPTKTEFCGVRARESHLFNFLSSYFKHLLVIADVFIYVFNFWLKTTKLWILFIYKRPFSSVGCLGASYFLFQDLKRIIQFLVTD